MADPSMAAGHDRPTLRQVAEAAGVSKGTVSRVLSGHRGLIRISPATEARVREIAARLEYQPNAAARALGRRRSETIAVVLPAAPPEHSVRRFSALKISEALSGIDQATSARGYSVLLQIAAGDPFEDPRHQRVWNSGAADAVLWLSIPLSDQAARIRLPSFAVNCRSAEGSPVPTLNTDDYTGSTFALEHLSRLGHRRIAHIAAPAHSYNWAERGRAYADFAASVGMAPSIVWGDGFEESGGSAVTALLGNSSPPTAIFVASDRMAFGALRELHSMGVRVPGDVAVIGADGLDFGQVSHPKLTTVGLVMHQATFVATNKLIDWIEDPTTHPGHVVAATELAIEESCGYREDRPDAPTPLRIHTADELAAIHLPVDSPTQRVPKA